MRFQVVIIHYLVMVAKLSLCVKFTHYTMDKFYKIICYKDNIILYKTINQVPYPHPFTSWKVIARITIGPQSIDCKAFNDYSYYEFHTEGFILVTKQLITCATSDLEQLKKLYGEGHFFKVIEDYENTVVEDVPMNDGEEINPELINMIQSININLI